MLTTVCSLNSCLDLHIPSVVTSHRSYFLTFSYFTVHWKSDASKLATLEPLDICFWYFLHHQETSIHHPRFRLCLLHHEGRLDFTKEIYLMPQANSDIHLEVSVQPSTNHTTFLECFFLLDYLEGYPSPPFFANSMPCLSRGCYSRGPILFISPLP